MIYNTLNVLYGIKSNMQYGGRVFMVEKKNILTYEGLQSLEEEIHDLKVNQRREVAQKIKEAREQGDLSENAEYDAAKDEQRDIEARIEEIEKILRNAEVVIEDEVDVNVINIGCKVRIFDKEYKEELTYKIVGSTEANSLKGKISNESPLGRELLGKKVGEIVDVESHGEVIQYEILEIQRSN
jgi:transcription elongation factor GreA